MRLAITLIALAVIIAGGLFWYFKKPERWAVYYNMAHPPEAFSEYDVLVFDRDGHPPLETLQDENRKILGYVSFGEAELNRSDIDTIIQLNAVISNVAGWEGNPFLDIRSPQWQHYFLYRIVPAMQKKGFNGIMIDTIDSLLWLEQKYPRRYSGLRAALVSLIHTMRQRFPNMYIMVNRGFDILPEIARDIDMLLVESIYTSWNIAENRAAMADAATQALYAKKIAAAKAKNPKLKIYALDYWDPQDVETIGAIYKHQRKQGYIPYVSTIDLQQIYAEPCAELRKKIGIKCQ